MTVNSDERYRVIYPGCLLEDGEDEPGFQIATTKYINEAREIVKNSDHPLTYIWDNDTNRGTK